MKLRVQQQLNIPAACIRTHTLLFFYKNCITGYEVLSSGKKWKCHYHDLELEPESYILNFFELLKELLAELLALFAITIQQVFISTLLIKFFRDCQVFRSIRSCSCICNVCSQGSRITNWKRDCGRS